MKRALAAVEQIVARSERSGDGAVRLAVDLMNDAISVVIPGAKNAEQARANIGAAALAPLSPDTMARIRSIDETSIRPPCISGGERLTRRAQERMRLSSLRGHCRIDRL